MYTLRPVASEDGWNSCCLNVASNGPFCQHSLVCYITHTVVLLEIPTLRGVSMGVSLCDVRAPQNENRLRGYIGLVITDRSLAVTVPSSAAPAQSTRANSASAPRTLPSASLAESMNFL